MDEPSSSGGIFEPVEDDCPSRPLDVEASPKTKTSPKYEPSFSQKRPWTKFTMGYPRYSAFISSDEDKSTTIFRRFQRLSARNLLYLESELAELEAEQDRLDEESSKDQYLQMSAQSWELLCLQGTARNSTMVKGKVEEYDDDESNLDEHRARIEAAAQQRLHLALRIREVLKTYHEALKLESEILALKPPERRPLKGARQIFMPSYDKKRGTGDGPGMIAGEMRTHLDEKHKPDLCVLAPPTERDRLTRLFEGRLSYFFRTRATDGLTDFVSHQKVSFVVTVLSGLMAIIFLIGAIVGLYWVSSPTKKLGILSGLTVAFAGTLALFTNARRQDVFAATAAYAAVLVVFISGNLSPGSSNGTTSTATSTSGSGTTSTSTITATVTSITVTSILQTGTAVASACSSANTSTNHCLSLGQTLGIGLGLGLGIPIFALSIWIFVRLKHW